EGVVPQKAARRKRERVAPFVGIAAREAAKGLLQVVGDVSLVDPLMPIGAEDATAIEVIEQRKLPHEGMVVGRYAFAEHHQAGVAVAFLQVAEDLVIGAVFLDDIDNVLDDRRLTVTLGHRYRLGVSAGLLEAGQTIGKAVVGVDGLGEAGKPA